MFQRINFKTLLSAFILLVAIHIITVMNRTYRVGNKSFSESHYRLMLPQVSTEDSAQIAFMSKVYYFDVLPENTVSLYYFMYLVIVVITVIKYNNSKNKVSLLKGIIAISLTIFLIGCTSQRKILTSWMGSTKHSLIMSWGPPNRIANDGNGGEVLIYGNQVYIPSLNVNYWDYKMMYADRNGKLYHWTSSRQPIPPTQIDIRFIR